MCVGTDNYLTLNCSHTTGCELKLYSIKQYNRQNRCGQSHSKSDTSELRHNVELACTPIYSGSATPNEHRVAIHCATRGSVIPGAGM